jgi:curved DNA-binding protein CbpA
MPEDQRIPRVANPARAAALALSPAEGFLLSRVDGSTPWQTLCAIGGLSPVEADRCLTCWLAEGVLALAKRGVGPSAAAADAGDIDISLVDVSLDLPVELQREILEFEKRLERSYHEILGVSRDADSRSIKRAYFQLSKRFHPDRYFRKRTGHFGPRLTRIFKRIVVASELLSDPLTRVELLRSLAQREEPAVDATAAPEAAAATVAEAAESAGAEAAACDEAAAAPSPGVEAAAVAERARKLALLERVRKQVRLPEKLLSQRRLRATQLYEAGLDAAHAGRAAEGAASIRLAIAFDPWSDAYKDGLAEVQFELHRQRAEALMAEAGASWDDSTRKEALELYEEALSYRPADARIHERAAVVALSLGELERALEYAVQASELAPGDADSLVALARVQLELEQAENARATLDRARRVAPRHEGVRAVQEALRSQGKKKNSARTNRGRAGV